MELSPVTWLQWSAASVAVWVRPRASAAQRCTDIHAWLLRRCLLCTSLGQCSVVCLLGAVPVWVPAFVVSLRQAVSVAVCLGRGQIRLLSRPSLRLLQGGLVVKQRLDVLFCTVLYCTVLSCYCAVLFSALLHCTVFSDISRCVQRFGRNRTLLRVPQLLQKAKTSSNFLRQCRTYRSWEPFCGLGDGGFPTRSRQDVKGRCLRCGSRSSTARRASHSAARKTAVGPTWASAVSARPSTVRT